MDCLRLQELNAEMGTPQTVHIFSTPRKDSIMSEVEERDEFIGLSLDEFMSEMLGVFPNSVVEETDGGEIVVYTGLKVGESGTLIPDPAANE